VNVVSFILAACIITSGNAARPNYLHKRSLFWVEESKGIFHLSETGERVCVVDTDAVIGDIAVDVNIPKLFWSEPENGLIKAFSFETGEKSTVVSGLQSPHSLAVDGERKYIFFQRFDKIESVASIARLDLEEKTITDLGVQSSSIIDLEVDSEREMLLVSRGSGLGIVSFNCLVRQHLTYISWGYEVSTPAFDRQHRRCFVFEMNGNDLCYESIDVDTGKKARVLCFFRNVSHPSADPFTYSTSMGRFILFRDNKLLAYASKDGQVEHETLAEFSEYETVELENLIAPVDSTLSITPATTRYCFLLIATQLVVIKFIVVCMSYYAKRLRFASSVMRGPKIAVTIIAMIAVLWLVTTTPILGRRLVASVGTSYRSMDLRWGMLQLQTYEKPHLWSGGFHVSPASLSRDYAIVDSRLWPSYSELSLSGDNWTQLWVPLWLIALPFTFSPIKFFIVLRRRRKRKLCLACGYDVSTGGQATCPECGWQVVIEEVQKDETNKEDDQNGWTLGG